MVFDREKFKALVHYVCWRCKDDPSKLGAVKLNKILWRSDFQRYYQTGNAITGARYVKRQFGPVPRAIKPALRDLEQEHVLFTKPVSSHGLNKTEFIVLLDADTEPFEAEELRLVDEIIQFVSEGHTAKSISESSHDHIWHAAADGEEIPYFTVFAVPGEITDDEREWARLELEELEAA